MKLLKIKSIKSKLILLVASSVIISVVATLMLSIPSYINVAKESTRYNMVNYVTSYSTILNNGIRTFMNGITGSGPIQRLVTGEENFGIQGTGQQQGAGQPDAGNQNGGGQQAAGGSLNTILSEYDKFLYDLYFADAEGVITNACNNEMLDLNMSDDENYVAVMGGNDYAVGNFEDTENGRVFTLAMALKDDEGTTQGVLFGELSVAYISYVMSSATSYTDEMYEGLLNYVKIRCNLF